ncbi:hypothetical protein BH09PAT1_BH09PAT1_1890 [soil metagenome]
MPELVNLRNTLGYPVPLDTSSYQIYNLAMSNNFIAKYKRILIISLVIIGWVILSLRTQSNLSNITQSSPSQVNGTTIPKITMSDALSQFQTIKTKTKWDITKPLVWGYYFYDHDQTKLDHVALQLKKQGFMDVRILPAAGSTDNNYLLYVSEKVVLTPELLYKQSQEFAKLATTNHLESYDGWEAGEQPL